MQNAENQEQQIKEEQKKAILKEIANKRKPRAKLNNEQRMQKYYDKTKQAIKKFTVVKNPNYANVENRKERFNNACDKLIELINKIKYTDTKQEEVEDKI